MLFRTFGSTGEKISILGFGCMRLPIRDGKFDLIDEETASRMLHYAVDNGVNYADTAFPYHGTSFQQGGMSEIFLGRALQNGYRDRINLATKLPSWLVKSRGDMDFYLDRQLERLQTDHIDFYLLHGLNAHEWINLRQLGVFEFLDAALADGRIRYAGFSFHDELSLFKEIVDAYDWSFCQIQYNFMDEYYQAGREGLEYAAARGLGVVVMEPLRGGSLTARIPEAAIKVWEQAEVRRSPAEWALRFVWNHPAVGVVLSGMTTMEHVLENCRIAGEAYPETLTESESALFEKVKEIYRSKTRVACTGCNYCMPCPQGVNIPGNFEFFNNAFMYDDLKGTRQRYNFLKMGKADAANCTQCGACEEKCPQKIKIRETLVEVMNTLDMART
jgi:predicted aldo/keto reductase-like oxidoreductase